MIISTKGRYALRVMIDLVQNQEEGYIPLKDIAERQDVSEKYLEAIIKDLVKAGHVVGLRGKGGGYKLSRDAATYTAWDAISATETGLSPVACLGEGSSECPHEAACVTLPMWKDFNENIEEFFKKYHIVDMV
ncbi:MAG: Rrf2 family transcriptional regulator [Lachnospiraceae bacterium]|nr:Rrf2 family transcriptional regulator [Lachnospiraceae bacterium]